MDQDPNGLGLWWLHHEQHEQLVISCLLIQESVHCCGAQEEFTFANTVHCETLAKRSQTEIILLSLLRVEIR